MSGAASIFAAVSIPALTWEFGGPLARLPSTTAWIILIGSGLVGLALIILSYVKTYVTLSSAKRNVLIVIRSALWIALLVALAGPTRIEKTYTQKVTRPTALLIDRSGSMITADHRGHRRIDDALRRWFSLAPAGPAPRVFGFSDRLVELKKPDDEVQDLAPASTKLFASLNDLLAKAPSGGWGSIVVLTDGLDTAEGDPHAAARRTAMAAQRAGTPLYFVLGNNLGAHENSFLACRELTLPNEVPPHSSFAVTLVTESYQAAARTLPTRVRVGDQWQPGAPLFVDAGRHVALWQQSISAEAPGSLPIEIEIGEGADRLRLQTQVAVTDPTRMTHVLYYEGALDWSRKFLFNLLRRDAAFDLAAIIHIEPKAASLSQKSSSLQISALPNSAEGFRDTDLLVIANAAAEQISDVQQKAISAWVSGGGTLLFLAPDDRSTNGYVGTELEKLLPVVFPGHPAVVAEPDEVRAFRRQMSFLGHSNSAAESSFAAYAIQANTAPNLVPFAWEPAAKEIFSVDGAMPAPLFFGYAKVVAEKPGARVYARHPSELAPNGSEQAILLAMQPYGRGQVAALTCDVLWRWKLQEASDHREVETFWQQLFAWLGRQHQREQGLHFDHVPIIVEQGKALELHVKGEHLQNLHLTASTAETTPQLLTHSRLESGEAVFPWTPSAAGFWSLEATNERLEKITQWVTVQKPAVQTKGEYSGQPPDEAVTQELATATGGAILSDTQPTSWLTAESAGKTLLGEHHFKLWERKIFLEIFLSLYVIEWLLRRKFKLL